MKHSMVEPNGRALSVNVWIENGKYIVVAKSIPPGLESLQFAWNSHSEALVYARDVVSALLSLFAPQHNHFAE